MAKRGLRGKGAREWQERGYFNLGRVKLTQYSICIWEGALRMVWEYAVKDI